MQTMLIGVGLRCVADAAPDLIRMHLGVRPRAIDNDKIELESKTALKRCPTGAIARIEGAQFAGGADRPARLGS